MVICDHVWENRDRGGKRHIWIELHFYCVYGGTKLTDSNLTYNPLCTVCAKQPLKQILAC